MNDKSERAKHPKGPKDHPDEQKQKLDADEIVVRVVQPEIERRSLELFRTPSRVPYATVRVDQHFETYPVESGDLKDFLSNAIYSTLGFLPKETVIKDIVRQLRARALYDKTSIVRLVFHRIAEDRGNVYLDLCDPEWRVIEITPTGWWLAKNPEVRFVRSSSSCPLPVPEPGGNLNDIFRFVHVARREHKVLFLSWLAGALQTHASYPVLMVCGSHGAAKTTACRIAARLTDPANPELVGGYSSDRDLLVSAMQSHVMFIDNVSEIDDHLSDALCRLSTGSGMRRRKLYSDSGLFAVSVKKPIIVNGITQSATRGDLLDRMITLRLDPMPEKERREEAKLLTEFEDRRPALLGALLTAVSAALRNLRHLDVTTIRLPRMADFATWVSSCARELGFTKEEFLEAYKRVRQEASDATLEFSPIGIPLMELVDASGGSWRGSVKDLLTAVNGRVDEQGRRDPDWPKSAKALAATLSRIDANLDAAGYAVRWQKKDSKTRRRMLSIEKRTNDPERGEGNSKRVVVEFPADAEMGSTENPGVVQ